jgi:hypothetical protein
VFAVRVSPGGPTAAPDAPPASDNAPATPNIVKAFVRPLRFEFLRFEFRLPRDMVEVSHLTPRFNMQLYNNGRRSARPGRREAAGRGLAIPDWGGKLYQVEFSQGDGLMKRGLVRLITLFSAVAVALTLTVAVTLSGMTLSSGGVGKLKCYELKGGTEKACKRVGPCLLLFNL